MLCFHQLFGIDVLQIHGIFYLHWSNKRQLFSRDAMETSIAWALLPPEFLSLRTQTKLDFSFGMAFSPAKAILIFFGCSAAI